ncbi:hypothetical protein CerSpe_145080 [Prunus speciosa]
MALLGSMLIIVHLSMVVLFGAAIFTPIAAAAQALLPQAKPGCPEKCGNLTIPYPFGIGDGCYLRPEFDITCSQSSTHPTYLTRTNRVSITNFNFDEAELQIAHAAAYRCHDARGNIIPSNSSSDRVYYLMLPPLYTISDTKNKLFVIGCETFALLDMGIADELTLGYSVAACGPILTSSDKVPDTCSGVGCTKSGLVGGLVSLEITMINYSLSGQNGFYEKYPCSYAFLVEDSKFNYSPSTSFQQLSNNKQLPVVINWEVGDEPCDVVEKSNNSSCKGNSKCVDRSIVPGKPGYICKCLDGYHGNPYLTDGCQDINECETLSSNPCNNGTCHNVDGSYNCKCNSGYRNQDPKTCIPGTKNTALKISLGASGGFLLLLVGSLWIYWGMQRRKFIKLKEKYFKENGGLLLQQQLASQGGSMETTKLFTTEELEKATNNYHESRILGEGGYGTVYKGILPDKSVVAIKKSKVNGAPSQSDVFINEVIVLSQIKHRNVVRLLGCCLETPAPLLVYEFIVEGTLSEHIHKKNGKRSSLSWELRLNIATEAAGALAYLHSSALMQIIHRDVKATNILLDEHYTAKVSDFGASRLIPLDQTQLTTLVQGTLGYLDPEYFLTNQLTEKSDVYSFGVVLMELLTSKVALSFARPEEDRNLANFFVRFMEEDRLNEVLDDDIVNERNIETLKKVAEVAKRCVRLKGQDRPSMKEVAMELEGMRVTPKQPWGKAEVSSPKDTEYLLGSAMNSDAYFVDVRGDFDSRGATIGTTSG